MADISVTAANVAPVVVWEQLTGPAAEAIEAGEMVRIDSTAGHFTQANATTTTENATVGMAITSANGANIAITVVKRGIIDLGSTALDSEGYGEALLLSDTDGKIDNGAGSPTTSVTVGRVIRGFGGTTAGDKLLLIDV